MSILEEKWNLSQQAQEFFVYESLGIVPERFFDNETYFRKMNSLLKEKDDEEDNIKKEEFSYEMYCVFLCAKAAYGDLNRTLEYKEEYKDGNKKKEKTINTICIEITKTILSKGLDAVDSKMLFDIFLYDDNSVNDYGLKDYLTDKRKKTGEKQEFTFGQVQKWVNMTLKYLYLLDLIDSDEKLHIPIDSYILEAFWYEDRNINIPKSNKTDKDNKEKYSDDKFKDHRKKYGYSDEKVKSWSQFSYNDYDNLYQSYIGSINKPYIEWEHENWIRISEKRKGITKD